MNILETKNLSKSFAKQGDAAKLEVLNGISFKFEQGKSYAIMGVSGSGKSTLLHLLAGLERPTSGDIMLGSKSIDSFTQAEMDYYLNKSIGLLFQDPFLIRELSVWQNVASKSFQFNAAAKFQAGQLLQKVGLEDKAEEYPAHLSGGQLQRVSILRALFNNPKFLLADEPTGNLDASSGKDLIEFLMKCKDQWGLGMVVTTHDSAVANKMDVVLNLQDGKLSFI